MFKRIKEFFNLSGELDMSGWFDQMEAESKASMPIVKPPKGKDISEPVFAMLNAWKQNPKRFKIKECQKFSDIYYNRWSTTGSCRNSVLWGLNVIDTQESVQLGFSVYLEWEAYSDISGDLCSIFGNWFGQHKVYPVLGGKVCSKPSWMTQDELEFITKTVTPYYLNRVNRYRDIVESRVDRTRKASELKSEIAKQKERQRLSEVYK
ncbi:hypothetical protein [Robertmurraya sp.]|uniref:hypothetical protein n=1 Tax=Robertmurraya sp. TaxID=2837525 RepID=UPI003704AE56